MNGLPASIGFTASSGRCGAKQHLFPVRSGKGRRFDFFSKPKSLCAFKTSELIIAVAPTTKLVKGDSLIFTRSRP